MYIEGAELDHGVLYIRDQDIHSVIWNNKDILTNSEAVYTVLSGKEAETEQRLVDSPLHKSLKELKNEIP